ncbi:MAG: hypothetical protein AAGF93_23500, partial [Cyanobacteria bacterium P01_H01_bin.105]
MSSIDSIGKVYSKYESIGQRLWLFIALGIFAAVTGVVVWWIFQHPFGTNWDEANYINQAIQDRTAFY